MTRARNSQEKTPRVAALRFPFGDRFRKKARKLPAWKLNEQKTLENFASLRARLRRIMVMMTLQPVMSLAVFLAVRSLLSNMGQSAMSASLAAAAIGVLVFLGLSVVLWLQGSYTSERCFDSIYRRSGLAAERIGLDDLNTARSAAETLFETWLDRILLIRWLRDSQYVFIPVSIVVGLLILSVSAYAAVGAETLAQKGATIAYSLIVAIAGVVRALLFSSRLIASGDARNDASPAGKVADRLEALITEVKELRRGARLSA